VNGVLTVVVVVGVEVEGAAVVLLLDNGAELDSRRTWNAISGSNQQFVQPCIFALCYC
jgi:hypothetical protein